MLKKAGPAAAEAKTGAVLERPQQVVGVAERPPNSTRAAGIPVVREEWRLFADLTTLPQKAGVRAAHLPRLVVKELVDNALDAAGDCRYGELPGGGFFVENGGDGIDKPDEDIAAIFSVARPLASTKAARVPSNRGALGNGTRVIAGAVLASGGRLAVHTRGRRLELVPRRDGTTRVTSVGPSDVTGTRVEVWLGGELAGVGDNIFEWAGLAVTLARARGAKPATDRPSVHWHDAASFANLCRDTPGVTVRRLLEQFGGLAGKAATAAAGDLHGRQTSTLTDAEAAALFARSRSLTRPPSHAAALGHVGELPGWGRPKKVDATYKVGGATVPVRVEVWARPAEDDEYAVTVCVNRTPTTAEVSCWEMVEKQRCYGAVNGCGVGFAVPATRHKPVEFLVSVLTPYQPITSDGKNPDLSQIKDELRGVVAAALKYAQRKHAGTGAVPGDKKGVILARLDECVAKAGGGGRFRYSLRQLFYAVRPFFLDEVGEEPKYGYFGRVIRGHELYTLGRDLPGIYRDNRGTLYHPHTREEIPLGTISVEKYKRPRFGFNKILYSEKEGLITILRAVDWPEEHDCALLTSKGNSTYAVRDVLAMLDDSDEPLFIFCIHDADGPGTVIYESLLEGVRLRAKGGRRVEVVNLGLEPQEAVEVLKLRPEPVSRKGGGRVAVAKYVPAKWKTWLQSNRVELNEMPSDQFIEWLTAKIAPYEGTHGKVTPPAEVVAERMESELARLARERLTAEVLRRAGIDRLVAKEVAKLRAALPQHADEVHAALPAALAGTGRWWQAVVDERAKELWG